MGFTVKEREFVTSKLLQDGWVFDSNTIKAPSGGIWFCESHFNDWCPLEMFDIIQSCGERVAREKHDGWEQFSKEHFQLCEAIKPFLNR